MYTLFQLIQNQLSRSGANSVDVFQTQTLWEECHTRKIFHWESIPQITVMKWMKTASSSVSLHCIDNYCSISMLLWSPELPLLRLHYCILFCMCMCQQLAFQRLTALWVTPDDNAFVHKLQMCIFPDLPTGITICLAKHKHNTIIRAHCNMTRFILSGTEHASESSFTSEFLFFVWSVLEVFYLISELRKIMYAHIQKS